MRSERRERRTEARALRRASRRASRALTGAGAALAAFLGLQPSAQADTFTVTNTNNAGAGSLRQAIADANANPDSDLITFQAGVTGTITLASKLEISESVEIRGPGATALTVSGNDATQAFYLYSGDAPHKEVVISGLTIAHGLSAENAGGIACWSENLTLDSVIVSDNVATSGKGGGVMASLDGASLTIRNSVISGNQQTGAACDGGGVYLYGTGTLAIEKSTISGNSAAGSGGGIYRYSSDGYAGALTIENTTISGNTAATGAGVATFNLDVSIRHVTIAGNTASVNAGGLRVFNGTASIRDTIIADGSSPGTTDDVETATATIDANYSLIELVGAATITGSNNITAQDPSLGPLVDHGGPTLTKMPAANSVVIDAGDPAFAPPPGADQRGLARVAGAHTDMGAIETHIPTGVHTHRSHVASSVAHRP